MDTAAPTFSGYRRQRKTRFSVRFSEKLSRTMITLGGIGTIFAIVLVCVFLVWVAVPLFMSTGTESQGFQPANQAGRPLITGVDSDRLLLWKLQNDGKLVAQLLDSGKEVHQQALFTGPAITSVSPANRNTQVLVGFADGSIRMGKISVSAELVDESKLPAQVRTMEKNTTAKYAEGVIHHQANGTFSIHKLKAEFDAAVVLSTGKSIRAVDLSIRSSGPILASLSEDGTLRVSEVTETKNLITGKVKRDLYGGELKIVLRPGQPLPDHVLINGVGDNVYLIWNEGLMQRVDVKNLKQPHIVEEVRLTDERTPLTAIQFMIGKTTLLVGDTSGRVRAWFRINTIDEKKVNETKFVVAHDFPAGKGAVQTIACSMRSRLVAVGYANGQIDLLNMTNERLLGSLSMPADKLPAHLMLAPKEDGLYGWSPEGLASWKLNVAHPEASFTSLIRPLWYEGYAQPAHVWQSSSGDDAFESKFGLWPLIFGTLKATFYSLLLGVPLALCAAVYTREFLHPKVRGVIKPTIEVMASLPSVVLGFLGALIIAPFVSDHVMTIVLGFITVPLGFALAGFLWHTLPNKWIRNLQSKRFIFIVIMLPCTILLTILLAKPLELLLFSGDFKRWLNRQDGQDSAQGWMILLMPVAGLIVLFLIGNLINPWLRRVSRTVSVSREAFLHLAKCLAGISAAILLSWLGAHLLAWLGFDPRTSFMGKYDQRNALVVGMMMGFAIIPIIYTLAEDALSSVPDHLRSASLGCGATTWQTASFIVLPTAMSGIFSAIMVGLGRAVGETMVVLMSAGNVPVLDMNIFNGFRTLSANIAVELPEAVQGSTHYRILFLAALTLFTFTFVLNTLAESMRQRFRKRAFEL